MLELQLDLFSDRGVEAEQDLSPSPCPAMVSADIEDEVLIAAIAESDLADSCELAAEAGRRQLAAAVPALAALCRRFAGFGTRRLIPEQAAAIEALALIGGRDAADAVSETIERAVAQGPGLQIALSAAARLGSRLSSAALRQLLQHPEPVVRANACRCARPLPELILLLIDLLDDLNRGVAISAACALGRIGTEARSKLKSLLRDDPSEDVIDAISSIADAECVVLLGRIARSRSILADAALASLDNIELASAAAVAAAIRRLRLPQQNSEHNFF
jgi:hypothetical protein